MGEACDGHYARAAEVWDDVAGEESPERLRALVHEMSCLVRRGAHAEAEPLAQQLLECCHDALARRGAGLPMILDGLRTIYRATGRLDEAAGVESRLIELARSQGSLVEQSARSPSLTPDRGRKAGAACGNP